MWEGMHQLGVGTQAALAAMADEDMAALAEELKLNRFRARKLFVEQARLRGSPPPPPAGATSTVPGAVGSGALVPVLCAARIM